MSHPLVNRKEQNVLFITPPLYIEDARSSAQAERDALTRQLERIGWLAFGFMGGLLSAAILTWVAGS